MGVFSKIAGVVGNFFQIGSSSGPGLANDGGSGNIGAYNSGQSAYVTVRGADPVVAHDLVTLGYGNTHFGGGSSLAAGSFTATLNQGQDEVFGIVTGLSGTPLKVIGHNIAEQGVSAQSGIKYDLSPYQLNSNGFNWRLSSSEYWPSSGPINLTINYVWSTT